MLKSIRNFFKRLETIVILISLSITIFISGLVGVAGSLLVHNFWGFFILALGVQFVIFAIINTVLQRKDTVEGMKLINQQLEAVAKFTIQLTCAYCQTPNTTPIQLNQENRFKCQSCNQVNGVKMQFVAAQITTPLNKVTIPIGDESIDFKVSA